MLRIESLVAGTFLSRVNRFVCECEIEGKRIYAHLPNSGRLLELLTEGRKIYAVRKHKKNGLPYRISFVEKNNFKILIDTALTNDLVEALIEKEFIPAFKGYHVAKREVYFGKRRFDFFLRGEEKNILLEVKNSTLFWNSLSMFPDCETKRGRAHIEELLRISGSDTYGAILFIVSSPQAQYFLPDFHNDYAFAKTLFDARNSIQIHAVSVGFGEDFSLQGPTELIIPWEQIEKVRKDRGIYVVIVEIGKEGVITFGSVGNKFFRKGYYVYSGSAMKNLGKRIDRHRKKRKRLFWHIDYLTSRFRPLHYFPIRIDRSYECLMAKKLIEICDWFVPDFGSSDCGCESHLVGFEKNPLKNEKFLDILLYFRMGILEKRLRND